MALPMIRSDSPPAYASALSKKLTPASRATDRQSRARLVSSWPPKVTQEPKDRTLICKPVRPIRRYSIAGSFAMVSPFPCPAVRQIPDVDTTGVVPDLTRRSDQPAASTRAGPDHDLAGWDC